MRIKELSADTRRDGRVLSASSAVALVILHTDTPVDTLPVTGFLNAPASQIWLYFLLYLTFMAMLFGASAVRDRSFQQGDSHKDNARELWDMMTTPPDDYDGPGDFEIADMKERSDRAYKFSETVTTVLQIVHLALPIAAYISAAGWILLR